jgi:hypothetical protein
MKNPPELAGKEKLNRQNGSPPVLGRLDHHAGTGPQTTAFLLKTFGKGQFK